jgi:flavin reductase (DIM6/NTAB) family NADH-FMN oxidoreductase RutF
MIVGLPGPDRTDGSGDMTRREHDPADLGKALYPLLNSVVVPRPIAWVSTVAPDGTDNLAPHSYFTVASIAPPVLAVTSIGTKDTVRNARATGEFVVSIVTRALADAANIGGTDYPPHMSEFDEAGLHREPSRVVRPPRVAESPVALECRLVGERSFGDKPSSSVMLFGEVVAIAVDERVLDGRFADIRKLDPVSRLGGNEWGAVGDVFELRRIPYAELVPEAGS